MSKRQGARTGLAKPRETERELLAEQWRMNGGALGSGGARDTAKAETAVRAMTGKPAPDGPPRPTNELVMTLMNIGAVLGDELLVAAARRLEQIGLGGGDYKQRVDAIVNTIPDIAVAYRVNKKMSAGVSQQAAIEQTAAELAVPSTSFKGACQEVKRALLRLKKFPRMDPLLANVRRATGAGV